MRSIEKNPPTQTETQLTRLSDAAQKVMLAVIENRVHAVMGSLFYLTPQRLMDHDQLKEGIVAQKNLFGSIDYLYEGEVVGTASEVELSEEEAGFVKSFVE